MSETITHDTEAEIAMEIVEQMGLGYEFRNCSCGRLPCTRLKPIINALVKREAEVWDKVLVIATNHLAGNAHFGYALKEKLEAARLAAATESKEQQ